MPTHQAAWNFNLNNMDTSNVTKLRNDLVKVYEDLRSKKIGISEASEAANVAGKIISTAKVQLEYNKYCGSKDAIKFLVGD